MRSPAKLRWLLSVPLSVLCAVPAGAEVSGRVTTEGGVPVEGARVEVGEESETTDRRGTFSFPGAQPPVAVRVTHPRFDEALVEVAAGEGADVTVVLVARQEVFDEVTVSATRDAAGGFQPVSTAATSVTPGSKPEAPSTLEEVIEGVPGVAENGQGGRFQTYSVRGTAGQRILGLLAGARIVTDRRAGVAFSFVDPLLIGTVDVLRGPSTSYYGSGAIGGVVQAFPARFEGTRVAAGYETSGDEHYEMVGWGGPPGEGDEAWNLGIAHRRAEDSETPDGERRFSRFEQWSGLAEKRWRVGEETDLELVVMPSIGRDIGKPNQEYPERTTLYPEEDHLVASLTARKAGSYRLNVWAHPNTLETKVVEDGETERVKNESTDFGANAQWELSLPGEVAGRVGVDYFGRRGVEAVERGFDAAGSPTGRSKTLDGSEDEAAVYGALRRAFGTVTVESGARFTWIQQDNAGFETRDDSAWSGFVGATAPLGGGFELAANLGTGLRFPTLSERFFTGTTGRGEVISNFGLDPERSVSGDLGLRYFGDRLFVSGYVFRNEIDDYIERVTIEPGVRTFRNLTSGTIEGVELSGFFQWSGELRLSWDGQTIDGDSDDGDPLSDIPADRVAAQADWSRGRWSVSGRLQHRFEKGEDEIGSGEQPVGSADLLSAAVSYEIREGFRLRVSGRNLLDETYLPSADDQSVPAAARSFAIGIVWQD